jgi:hypothetical protein
MKNHFSLLLFFLLSFSIGKAQTDYKQWEAGYTTVKAGQTDLFEKGIAAHAKKFHNADPYKMNVFSVLSGPNSGKYFFALGPCTFTQIEGRPASAEHDMDWQKNVTPYVQDEGETSYWRQDKDNVYQAPGSEKFTKTRFRNFTLLPGQRDRFSALLKQVTAVYKAKALPASYSVYFKWGASTGPNVIAEIDMEHWSFFDRPDTWKKDFDEVNGEGAYDRFMDDVVLCIDRSKTFDELLEYKPMLSSD